VPHRASHPQLHAATRLARDERAIDDLEVRGVQVGRLYPVSAQIVPALRSPDA